MATLLTVAGLHDAPALADPATTAAVIGAATGAVVGGLLALLGVSATIEHGRRQDRLDVRRRAYVAFLEELQRADRLGRRVESYTKHTDEAREAIRNARSRLLTASGPSYSDLVQVDTAEALLAAAEVAGVTKAEMQESFSGVRGAHLTLMLVAPRLIRQLAERALTATATEEFANDLGTFVAACRVDLGSDDDRFRHRVLRRHLDRAGRQSQPGLVADGESR